jgi:hypothetical protein
MKLQNKIRLIALVTISVLFFLGQINSITLRKSEIEVSADAERSHHKSHNHHKRGASGAAPIPVIPAPTFNSTNNTLSKSLFGDLNNTYVKQDMNTFKINNRRWADLKMNDKQLEDIWQDLIYTQNKDLTPAGARASIQLFTSQFESCDKNHDNVLSLPEFTGCMANDTYLSQITPPQARFATFANYSFTNATGFYPILYNLMDSYSLNYTNFHDYMLLRLMTFSWRKCSVNGPFLDEVSFECAIEIATGSKTLSRNTARHLYSLALELSNTNNVRNLDFISYYIIAQSARLFGKINNKEDSDVTRTEFNLALDSNVLPGRYNQDIVNHMFNLVQESAKPNQGVDLLSFVFYDFGLRLFEVPNAQKKWNLAKYEFTNVFNNYLFPSNSLSEVESIPQNNLTATAYQMYTYLNISVYHQEADHFLKFAQTAERTGSQLGATARTNAPAGNITFNLISTSSWLFQILDNDSDGYLNFYDYGNFLQIAYLFGKFDSFTKGRIVAGDLFEKFSNYADFPYVSDTLRERSKRFNLFPQDLYFDLMRTVLVLRIDDIINTNIRRVDPTTLYEVELKNVFKAVNLGAVPDAYLNKCLRGVDDNNVPKYDWECAFVQAITTTCNYLESSYSYLTVKSGNLTLTNTAFVNVDPSIK